jgi:hypothetical protein
MLELRTDGTSLELTDTRAEKFDAPVRARLDGWKREVFLACDRTRTLGELSPIKDVPSNGELREFLARCVEHELMLTNGTSWLNVAIHVPERPATEEVAPIPVSLPVLAGR